MLQHMNAKELHEHLQRAPEPPLLLDVREPWEYEKVHIEGSLNLPMSGIAHTLDRLDAERETVVICHHGVRSMRVADWLQQQGFSRLINLDGGIDGWSQQVDPQMTRY